MTSKIVQDAIVVTFMFNGHHKWATCPLCGSVGPQKEKTLEHLNKYHVLPGQAYMLIETQEPTNALNSFCVAVLQFDPDSLTKSKVTDDRKVLNQIKAKRALAPEIIANIEENMAKAEKTYAPKPVEPVVRRRGSKKQTKKKVR